MSYRQLIESGNLHQAEKKTRVSRKMRELAEGVEDTVNKVINDFKEAGKNKRRDIFFMPDPKAKNHYKDQTDPMIVITGSSPMKSIGSGLVKALEKAGVNIVSAKDKVGISKQFHIILKL